MMRTKPRRRNSVFAFFCAVLFIAGCNSASSTPAPPPPPIPPDTTPPSAPTGLVETVVSSTQINLSWTASTDNVGVTGYKVERCSGAGCSNFAQIATPTSTSYSDMGLTASTNYSYRVRAADAAGNLSAYSSSSTAETEPPTFTPPSNLTATAVGPSQVNLSWTAGTETGGTISQYLIERCSGAGCGNFTQIGTSTTTTFSDTGLNISTSYSYRVRATDAGNNLSAYSASATATTPAQSGISVSLTPRQGGVVISQTLGFTATVNNDVGSAGVTWSTTGGTLTGQTLTVATFSSATAGSFTITATSNADTTQSASTTIGVTDLPGVATYHDNLARDGTNTREFALTPSNVNASSFGKLFSCSVDGNVYAQPLWIPNLTIGGGTHNVVFVATQNDSVYAFDADATPCVTYWQKSFLSAGVTPVPQAETGQAFDINVPIGITGTPVIDPSSNTLYVVAKTKETIGTGCSVSVPCYHQRVHALDILNGGNEKFGGPVDLTPAITVPGSGDTGDSSVGCTSTPGNVPFCPLREAQRPGLALANGIVYVAWASHGDVGPYHGWIMGFTASNLLQAPIIFNDSPNGGAGGIWMSGGAPAFDSSSSMYVITGNGDYDGLTDFGDSILRLNGSLVLQDWFTPNVQGTLAANDLDLGSGGAVVLVDLPSSTVPHILIGGGKGTNFLGQMYVINRDPGMMGQLATPDKSVQQWNLNGMIYSTAAFWQNTMYIAAVAQPLSAYVLNSGTSLFNTTPAWQSAHFYGFPGATPSVSSRGTTQGIVWAIDTNSTSASNAAGTDGPAVLFAYDPQNGGALLYSSDAAAGSANASGNAVKFAVPTVANGKVYIGTQTELDVFGLLP